MTQCFKGGHDFPIEDELGGYCEEHGVTAIWKRVRETVPPPHPLMPQPAAADEPPSRAT